MKRMTIAAMVLCAAHAARAQNVDWPNVGNDKGGMRYSKLDQVNRDNVSRLDLAWMYHTGDAGTGTTIECTPLAIDGTLYLTTVQTKIVALDAATGKEKWRYDPYPPEPVREWRKASGGVNRGLAYWTDGQKEQRLIAGLPDGRLLSLDLKTGQPDKNFGQDGFVDLRADMERDLSNISYGPTSAPAVFENRVIIGCSTDESVPAAPGDVRAFDVLTGKQAWRFHTVPQPGEFGHDTWQKDQWKDRGGANPWSGFNVDQKNGLVFCGTGSVVPDFFGGGRTGPNLFGNCTLALDAHTGERKWHFQTVHHDLWDHDNPTPPVMVTVKRDGKEIEAVAQLTKTGYCFLFDRHTGEPLFDVKETPVPKSDIPGEEAAPTQPVPAKPPALSRIVFNEDEVTNISPQAHEYVREKLQRYRHGEAHIPPSVQGSIVMPGFHGGANWSGASFDPTSGLLYVNSNNTPFIAALKQMDNGQFRFAGYDYFTDAEGYPGIKPPWGNLTAIDLGKGEFAWRITLGEFTQLKARGVPQTGTETFGGTIVTAGGLVFIGGTKDEKFHAFDKTNGKLLWDYALPAGGYATPCTYMAGGRQYVVIAAGGGGKLKTRSGDAFVAFALPFTKTP